MKLATQQYYQRWDIAFFRINVVHGGHLELLGCFSRARDQWKDRSLYAYEEI
jgi:hypothetical protein